MEQVILGLETVKEYYGKTLKSNKDLLTNACCTTDSMPKYLIDILKEVHEEVKDKFYGCGSPIPLDLKGKTVLDLGSGSGRDCFILSKLVGESGQVIGIDMTEEQIEIANKHIDYHTEKFGYKKTNVQFLNGFIEDLKFLGIPDASVDIVVSNCVINLSPDKEKVFSEIFRVLKPGGELYFSDVFSSRRLPESLKNDPVLLGECLGGALYTEDFRRLLYDVGCKDFRVITNSKINLQNRELEEKVGLIEFNSITVRTFKLDLEDRCEDFGQAVRYLGTIKNSENAFVLDDHHTFEKGKIVSVCGNTAMMLEETRYKEHFEIIGDKSIHYGLFDCAPTSSTVTSSNVSACC